MRTQLRAAPWGQTKWPLPAKLRDEYTVRWEDQEEDLGRSRFGELFSHIRMIYRKAKPQGTLLKEFHAHVTEAARAL